MKMIKRILIPVDFSDYSKHALKYAVDLAKNFKAKLYIIYVFEPAYSGIDADMMSMNITLEADIEKIARKELDRLYKKYVGKSLKGEILFMTGKPFVRINQAAKDLDIDLIVIATHGQTGIKHLLFGSTAEKVVRKAPCPVMTIREPVKGFQFSN